IRIEHRQQVRVNRRLSVRAAEKSEGEPDQLVLVVIVIKGPYENIARRLAGNGQRQGQGVFVRHPPDFFLHRLQLAEVVDALEVANSNLWRATAGFHGWPCARFEFGFSGHGNLRAEFRRRREPIVYSTGCIFVNMNQRARGQDSSTTKDTKKHEV